MKSLRKTELHYIPVVVNFRGLESEELVWGKGRGIDHLLEGESGGSEFW